MATATQTFSSARRISAAAKASFTFFWGSADGLQNKPFSLPGGYGFGDSVAGVGDTNGDGFADIAATANPGLYFYFGGASGPTTTPVVFDTHSGGCHLSNGVDVNGDGFADVTAGEPNGDNDGYVDIHLGGPIGPATDTITLSGSTNPLPGIFAFSIANAGDVNADGFGDIIVGTSGLPYQSGGAAIYLGNSSGLSMSPIFLTSPARGAEFGWSVAGAGDTNGDGFADVVVGGGGTCTSLFLGSASGTSSNASLTTTAAGDGYSAR